MATRTEVPDDAANRQESMYETSCAETDDVSLADTEQPDYDVNAAWDIDKILAQAEFESDSDGEPITDDAGEPSTVTKYLVKWTGYSLKSATWQDKEAFVDGAEKILWAWFDQHMNEKRGHKEVFDVGRWEDWCNKVDDVRDERHAKRNKKRKKLGLPVVVYPTDDADADDEEVEESHDVPLRTKDKKAGKGKGRAEADGDELGSGDMDISSSAADDEPLSTRRSNARVASVRTTKRLPFTDSDVDDNDKNQSDGDDVIMTGSARIKRRRTAVAMEKEREQTRELMKRKKGRAVPVAQGRRTSNAHEESTPKQKSKSAVVKAKDIAPSSYFASLKARTAPTARPAVSTTDAASQSAGAAPTARMVGGPGQSKPKGRTATTATTSTTNIFLPSVAKAPSKVGPANTKFKTLSHKYNALRKQRNEAAPDMSALTLFTPGSAIPKSTEMHLPSKTTEKPTTNERRVSLPAAVIRKGQHMSKAAGHTSEVLLTQSLDTETSENATVAMNTPATREADEAWSGMVSSLRASASGANTTPIIRKQPNEARSDNGALTSSALATTTSAATRPANEARPDIQSPTNTSNTRSFASASIQSRYPLYTCAHWARGLECYFGRDCAYEHYHTGVVSSSIPRREITCAFWAKGKCRKSADQCKFVHAETRYIAGNPGQPPARLSPDDILESVRKETRPGNPLVEDAVYINQSGQDALSKPDQEQGAIPTKKWELTCWFWLFQTPPCRNRGRDCLWSHTEQEYVAPKHKGETPILYKHALEQIYGGSSSNTRSQLPMLDGAREYDDEPLSMLQASSPPRSARVRQDTDGNNIGRTVLPDLSVRRGTQTFGGANSKTMSSTQLTSNNSSSSLRRSRTDLIPAVLVINPPEQVAVPIDVDLEITLFGAQKDLFNVPEPGAEAQLPRVIQINHICSAEFARTNFDFTIKQILAKGNILTTKADKRMVASFCQTLDLNSSGAVMQHEHFAMFVIPAGREQWKFLGLQHSAAHIQLQFVATATSRSPVAAVVHQSPVAAVIQQLPAPTAPMQLPVATSLVQSPLTATPVMPNTSRIGKFDTSKLFDKNGEMHAFLMVHQEEARDIEILTAGLHEAGATVYLMTETGAWSKFCSLASGGAVIVHPNYDKYYEVPDLAGVLRQQIHVKFFSFDPNNATDPFTPLFPHGRAVFVMDSLWEDHVDDAIRLLDALKPRLTAHPDGNRLVGRPDLERWLYKLAKEETDPELCRQRHELWGRVYSHLHAKPEYLGRWPEADGPTSASPVFFEPGDVYADYADLYINDSAKAEDTMAEWFCRWSLRHVDRFRNFIIVSAGAQRQRMKWLNQFKHVDVQTTAIYKELETAKGEYERKRKEEFERKKRKDKEKEAERVRATRKTG